MKRPTGKRHQPETEWRCESRRTTSVIRSFRGSLVLLPFSIALLITGVPAADAGGEVVRENLCEFLPQGVAGAELSTPRRRDFTDCVASYQLGAPTADGQTPVHTFSVWIASPQWGDVDGLLEDDQAELIGGPIDIGDEGIAGVDLAETGPVEEYSVAFRRADLYVHVKTFLGPYEGRPALAVAELRSITEAIARAIDVNIVAAMPTQSSPTTASPAPPTTAGEFGTCFIEGVVTDAGARPADFEGDGHPLIGVRLALVIDPDAEVRFAATDGSGRYQLTVSKEDLPPTFDLELDPVWVRLRLREISHNPSRFEVLAGGDTTSLLTDPFILGDECDDGSVVRDFLLGDIPVAYDAEWPPTSMWPDVGEIYDRIHRATQLADLLQQPLDYGLPLRVCAFCTGVVRTTRDFAFWRGCGSGSPDCTIRPIIGLGDATSLLEDGGWPDNRSYHEFGHHFLADAFGNAIPSFQPSRNHGGYYVNPSSTDSWKEGFAEFFSMMVSKHIDSEPLPHFYRVQGSQMNVELDYRPWLGRGRYEELALAGILLDLEDGPDDYSRGRELPDLKVVWHDVTGDAALGRVLVGEVSNNSPSYRNFSEQTMVAAQFFDDSGREAHVGWASTVPWDVPGSGGRGFFAMVVPPSLEWASITAVAFEGRPGDVLTDDDPVDLTLQEVWDTIVLWMSLQSQANGYLFDAVDLHAAFKTSFGGRDADGNGVDDIDQVFIAHGVFADGDGDRSFLNEEPGPTDHPARGPFPGFVPRRDLPPLPGALVEVTAGGIDIRVVVQVDLDDGPGYSYLSEPDDDGRVHVAMPPPGYGATAALIVLAEGYDPAIAGVLEADVFWEEVDQHEDEPFLSFDANLTEAASSSGSVEVGWLMLAAGGLLLLSAGVWMVVTRRRSEPT